MSGHGRRKRAPRHIGALNGCLCGMVINPNVDSSVAIECKQPGCETHGYVLQFCITEIKLMTYNVIQYHLQCVALEQAPMKWVCEACKASGGTRAKRPRK